MTSAFKTIAVSGNFGLVEHRHACPPDSPDPDNLADDSLVTICEPHAFEHMIAKEVPSGKGCMQTVAETVNQPCYNATGPCFIVNACARAIQYNNVFADLTHVHFNSSHGIDCIGHTKPGENASFAGNPTVPWHVRFEDSVETVKKCIEDGIAREVWTGGVVLFDVPNDRDWVKAEEAVKHMSLDTSACSDIAFILIRDDKPRMVPFAQKSGQWCFMLSDRGVYNFTKLMEHAIASPLFPEPPPSWGGKSMVSTFLEKVLGCKKQAIPSPAVYNLKAPGAIVKCSDGSPMTCVTSDQSSLCDFTVGDTTGIRIQFPSATAFTVRAIVKMDAEISLQPTGIQNAIELQVFKLIDALLSGDKTKGRLAWAELNEPDAVIRRSKDPTCTTKLPIYRFLDMAVNDYETQHVKTVTHCSHASLARNSSIGHLGWQ